MDNVNGNDNQPKQITIAIHMYKNIIGIREMRMRQKKKKQKNRKTIVPSS